MSIIFSVTVTLQRELRTVSLKLYARINAYFNLISLQKNAWFVKHKILLFNYMHWIIKKYQVFNCKRICQIEQLPWANLLDTVFLFKYRIVSIIIHSSKSKYKKPLHLKTIIINGIRILMWGQVVFKLKLVRTGSYWFQSC